MATAGIVGRDGHGDRLAVRVRVRRILEIARSGTSVEEVGHAGPGADEHRLEDPGVGAATDDDDVVGAGAGAELLDDRADDRVGRDRAGQALQDPGEDLGLRAAAGSSSWTACRWRTAAKPTITIRAATAASSGRAPGPNRRRTEIRPRMKNVPAKMNQERRIRGSSAPADGRRSVGCCHVRGRACGSGPDLRKAQA